MKISMVVAVSINNAIGGNGDLLWRLPKDMQRFKEITYGHHVLMGRKTYESIPEKFRPLPGRANIVVTRQIDYTAPGCKVVSSVDEGIQFARDNGEEELMVIGGAEIYRQLLPHTDTLCLTTVQHSFPHADAFFPDINQQEWVIEEEVAHPADEKHLYPFVFITLKRKSP